MKHRTSGLIRVIALMLVCTLTIPCFVSAVSAAPAQTYQVNASDYISSYNSYICPMGNGQLQIWFTVLGKGDMDDIGALTIELYESTDNETWAYKKTFYSNAFVKMLGHNTCFHSEYVPYPGVAGNYYKAYVCIYAGKDGGGDSRYFWTGPEQAT